MKSIFGSYTWLLSPFSNAYTGAWGVSSDGSTNYSDLNVYIAHGVAPVLYLDSNIMIDNKTTGSSTDPYKLVVS